MKRILIVNNNMHIGGVQKALVSLLQELRTDYDITLLLFYCGGELCGELPEGNQLLSPSGAFRCWGMSKSDVTSLSDCLLRAFWAGLTRVFGRPFSVRLASAFQKRLGDFDVAISYLHSGPNHMFYGGCNEFVLNCVNASQKLTFLHCDYKAIKAGSRYNEEIYRRFDGIVACSEGCKRSFLSIVPQFSEKTVVVPNFQDYGAIQQKARLQPVSFDNDRLNILTVARFGREKGILRALRAVAKLGQRRSGIRYYIIGNGTEYAEAKKSILDLDLGDTVFLLGEMSNPYGYIQGADVLLIPSFSEAAPLVIREAACLGTPVLTTETSSAVEMVQATGWGWVCPNTQDGITQGIQQLLDSPQELQKRQKTLCDTVFDNSEARRKFSELINGHEKGDGT